MKYILLIIAYNILSIFSAYEIKPKLCIDCKFFRKDNLSNDKFGKCSFFPDKKDYDDDDMEFLVTGIKKNKKEFYYFCSTSRKYEDMCGKEGRFYEKK